jgi:hypothetical protein
MHVKAMFEKNKEDWNTERSEDMPGKSLFSRSARSFSEALRKQELA